MNSFGSLEMRQRAGLEHLSRPVRPFIDHRGVRVVDEVAAHAMDEPYRQLQAVIDGADIAAEEKPAHEVIGRMTRARLAGRHEVVGGETFVDVGRAPGPAQEISDARARREQPVDGAVPQGKLQETQRPRPSTRAAGRIVARPFLAEAGRADQGEAAKGVGRFDRGAREKLRRQGRAPGRRPARRRDGARSRPSSPGSHRS